MTLGEDFQPFSFEMVSQIPHAAGVFQLANDKREVVFIGKAEDMKNDLLHIFDSYDPCFEDVRYYVIEMNPEINAGYMKLFRNFKEDHRGKIPKCNDHDPTMMDSMHLSSE